MVGPLYWSRVGVKVAGKPGFVPLSGSRSLGDWSRRCGHVGGLRWMRKIPPWLFKRGGPGGECVECIYARHVGIVHEHLGVSKVYAT